MGMGILGILGFQTLILGGPALSQHSEGAHWSFSYLKPAQIYLQIILMPGAEDFWLAEQGWLRSGVHFPGRVSGRAFVPQGLLSPCQN